MFTQTITVPEGKAIQLHFTDFNTEPGTDYVVVTSGNSYYLAPHLSGNSLPNDIVSPQNTVYVQFKTHYKSPGRSGWRLEWTEVPSPAGVQPACPRSSEFQLASGCYHVRIGVYDSTTGDYGSATTWAQAMVACQFSEGWNLATIESEEESMAIASVLAQITYIKKFWIALGHFEEDADWTWHTQEYNETISYSIWDMVGDLATVESYRGSVNLDTKNVTHEAWAPHQPDNQSGDENCAYINAGKPGDERNGKWNDYSCDKNRDGGDIAAICKAVP